jgi:hypothetical protein
MKLTWTIGMHDRSVDVDEFIRHVKANQAVALSKLNRIDKHVIRIDMSPALRDLWNATLSLAKRNPACPKTLSSLIELLAGIDYAATSPEIGRLDNLRKSYNTVRDPRIIADFGNYAYLNLINKKYRQPNMWFELRIRAMDAHALCIACGSNDPLIIYYAGAKHTEYFMSHMIDVQDAKRTAPTHEILDDLLTSSLISVEILRWKDKTIILLGENHDATKMEFAMSLMSLLKKRCNSSSSCTFMIERHLDNSSDNLQQHLMCNIPKCALHRVRCDTFFAHEKNNCSSLSVHFVDTRHIDCGFLRREILDAWYVDKNFRRKAKKFQKKSLQSVVNFTDVLIY